MKTPTPFTFPDLLQTDQESAESLILKRGAIQEQVRIAQLFKDAGRYEDALMVLMN